MMKTVIRLSNDSVMVFDAEGEQIPEYQGQYNNVRERIINDAPPGTVFNHWFGHTFKPRSIAVLDW